jgi:hypothetical protein
MSNARRSDPARAVGCAAAVASFASAPALAQYAPVPGVRDSLLPALVLPWVLLAASVLWALTVRARRYRWLLLKPVMWSVLTFIAVITVLFFVLLNATGVHREEVAATLFYLVLFSGPLVFVVTLGAFLLAFLRHRYRSNARAALVAAKNRT